MTLHYNAAKTSIDAFSTGTTPNTSTWTNHTGADVSISGGILDIVDRLETANPDDGGSHANVIPGITSKTTFDVTASVLAIKWRTPSGTHTPTTNFRLELDDASGNYIGVLMFIGATSGGGGTGDASQFYALNRSGAGSPPTVSDPSGSTSGLGLDLADGTWVGIGCLDGNKVRIFTSTDDGVTWSLFRELVYTGNFSKTAAMLYVANYHTDTGAIAGWHARIDEAAQFKLYNSKVRVGGAWVGANAKTRVSGAWVHTTPKRRVGGAWI